MSRLFYYNNHSRPVFLTNTKPLNMSRGGLILYPKKFNKDDKHEDNILAHLEDGSLVVPRPVVEKGYLNDYLKNGGKIHGPKVTDKDKLVRTIVMPHEVIVNSKHTNKVINHLKKKGIKLPIEDSEFSY